MPEEHRESLSRTASHSSVFGGFSMRILDAPAVMPVEEEERILLQLHIHQAVRSRGLNGKKNMVGTKCIIG